MSTEEMLLRAICANPKEDTPRLELADHYQETGRWERAEFVTRAIANHYRPATDPLYRDEQFWIEQWVDRHGLDWVPEVPGIDWTLAAACRVQGRGEYAREIVVGRYFRGFVGEAYCTLRAWGLLGSDLTAHLPIEYVRIRRVRAEREWWTQGLDVKNGDGTTKVGSYSEWMDWAATRWPQIEFTERQTTRAETNYL